ncbi:MAG TPA: hypothetical protein VNG51_20975 [Ktedonobacteraceae bacterium]|nr:hypothetical protein [Ktedonobacteraceae bacterium]
MPVYEIRIKGYLDQQWSTWFDGMKMTYNEDGETVLTGPVLDQSALHGLKIHNLNLQLISVLRVETDATS